jgi:hypothetical protein
MTILDLQPPFAGTYSFQQVTDVAQVLTYPYAGQSYTVQTRRFRPGTQVLTLDDAFPGQGTAAARTNLIIFPPDNKPSSVVQWSFDIQRELPSRIFLTVGYVGSKTSNIDNTIPNFNNPDPSPDTDINSRRPWQAYMSAESTQPQLLGNIRYLDSFANGFYQALQVTANKRYSNGITFGLAYTFSKALGEGYGRNDPSGDVNSTYQNPRNRRADRQRYGFDATHNAVINFVYDLPIFRNAAGLKRTILGGWQASGIVSMRTGTPFTVNGGNLNTGSPVYPDRIADGRLGDKADRQLWYDPTAFRRTDCNLINHPELCHYGNAAPDALVSPGLHTFDLSGGKNWVIKEKMRVQFRAEAFNAFNTPQFGRPNNLGWASPDSLIPDAPRVGEIRSLRQPMRIYQMGLKFYF